MKENTKLLLVWLSSSQPETRWVEYAEIKTLLSGLSDSGIKSLLFLLKKNQLISLERFNEKLHASLTSHGKRSLESEFPAFSERLSMWRGEWSVIIFLKPPVGDKNFRFLRKKLLSLHFLPLSRGVFLYPGDIPENVTSLCDQLYREAALVLKTKEWVFGDELETIGLKSGISDTRESYSSISKEIDELIVKIDTTKGLMEGDREQILSVFYRLYLIMTEDMGIGAHYFPQEEGFFSLLLKLQGLFVMG